jgi:hypothetical protein
VAGGVAEETSGFIDLFVECEGVTQSYLAAGIEVDKGAVELVSGGAGRVHSVAGLAKEAQEQAALTVDCSVVHPVGQ